MNKITKELTLIFQPAAALIAYACETDYRKSEYYLELRKIGKDGIMQAGKPVSRKFIQSLAENFTVETSSVPHGEIPRELMFANTREGKYVWYSHPCSKFLFFKSSLNIPNGKYFVPGLVWQVKDETLYLFAYKAKRPTSNMQLFYAPFFNVNSCGSVCLGNSKLELPEKLTFQEYIKYWEDKFFLSEFSHVLGDNPTKSNLVLVTLNSIQNFDNDELRTIKKLKLKDLLK